MLVASGGPSLAVPVRGSARVRDGGDQGLHLLGPQPQSRPGARGRNWAVRRCGALRLSIVKAYDFSGRRSSRRRVARSGRRVELRPSEMEALRAYIRIAALLRVPPAEGLAERVRTAYFDWPGNRWSLRLNAEQIESVAYAFYLRSMGGSVTEAIRFGRAYGVAFHPDRAAESLRLTRLR